MRFPSLHMPCNHCGRSTGCHWHCSFCPSLWHDHNRNRAVHSAVICDRAQEEPGYCRLIFLHHNQADWLVLLHMLAYSFANAAAVVCGAVHDTGGDLGSFGQRPRNEDLPQEVISGAGLRSSMLQACHKSLLYENRNSVQRASAQLET